MVNQRMMKQDFLFEIGTEELPAKQLSNLGKAFLTNVLALLREARLDYTGDPKVFVTPRRLAIFVPQLVVMQKDQVIERKGPSIQNAFDSEGKPTKACEGFAKSCGISVKSLEQRDTPEGKCLFSTQRIRGKKTTEILPALIQTALDQLPIAKSMVWGEHSKAFLRPVRWVLMLFGKVVVPATFFDQITSRLTCGHRFLVKKSISIKNPSDYEKVLISQGKVIADFEKRQKIIYDQLQEAAHKINAKLCLNESLLMEVTGLVEWPVVLTARFDPRFLEIPNNALIASMERHQKSFAVRKAEKLLPYFLTVSNITSKNKNVVIRGNECVMAARLNDAEFFYQKDLKIPLENYRDDLKKVIFQTQLGSVYEKSEALLALSSFLADQLKFNQETVCQAVRISKCDLRTQMVGEFPELQGEMGRIYAQKEGLPKEVSEALWEQYLPRFAKDHLPESKTGIVLALADRLLNLVGIFGIGQIPTGEKDPFGLRRAAIGICRIILDKRLDLAITPLILNAESAWQKQRVRFTETKIVDKVYAFLMERLRFMYIEEGIRSQVIQAVMALHLDNVLDIHQRIDAVNLFQSMPESASLIATQKRVVHLLPKEKLKEALEEPNVAFFELVQEKALVNALIEICAETDENIKRRKYTEALQKIAELKKPVDDFFDHVMVMTEDAKLRHNRLCLLAKLSKLMNQVAELSYL